MKALVTGGSGFIGSEVVRQLLSSNHEVRVFSRKKDIADQFGGKIEAVPGDLENPRSLAGAMRGIDVLYHIGEIKNTSKRAAEKNVTVIKEVLNEVTGKRIKRIVFVSSITVAGIPAAVPATEETPVKIILNDHYTDYKRRAEKLLGAAGGNCEYAIIRPGFVFGPGSRYLGNLLNVINRIGPFGIPFPGNAMSAAPLIYVKDVASAIVRAGMEPMASGQKFNLTDGLRHSWIEFLESIAGRRGKKLRIIAIPKLLMQMSAFPLDIVAAFIGIRLDARNYINYFSTDLYFDNAKACNLLNWQPCHSLADGVKEMTDFYAWRQK